MRKSEVVKMLEMKIKPSDIAKLLGVDKKTVLARAHDLNQNAIWERARVDACPVITGIGNIKEREALAIFDYVWGVASRTFCKKNRNKNGRGWKVPHNKCQSVEAA